MHKFAVFDHLGPAKAFVLQHALLYGSDDVALAADFEFDEGIVECHKRSAGAAALALQVDVTDNAAGASSVVTSRLTLRTALLPERAEPYLLTLELARRQVQVLLVKLEEWALFDQPAETPAVAMVHKAVERFTEALVAGRRDRGGNYSLATEEAAREALRAAIRAGDALCILAADVQNRRRISGELAAVLASKPPTTAITDHEAREARHALVGSAGAILPDAALIGCSINPSVFSPELGAMIVANCDYINIPMRWNDMEPGEGKYAFAKVDKWIEWAVRTAKLPVVAGPVFDLHPRCVPRWLAIWENDYDTLRDLVIEYLKTLVTRYRRTVSTWTICSGLHAPGGLNLSPEQVMDLTKFAVAVVKKLQPTAKIIVEISQPYGEYNALPRGARAIPPAVYGELLNQLALPVDSIGLRLQCGHNEPGRATRDMLSMSDMLDRFAAIDRPISLSALGAPSGPINLGPDDADPGFWRGPWSPESQAQWLAMVGAIAASKPYVSSICWHDLYDTPSPAPLGVSAGEMPGGGLTNGNGQPKLALAALGRLRAAVRDKKPSLLV